MDDLLLRGTEPLRSGVCGGRYWVRTSDLFGVNEARYHCANRPRADTIPQARASSHVAGDPAGGVRLGLKSSGVPAMVIDAPLPGDRMGSAARTWLSW